MKYPAFALTLVFALLLLLGTAACGEGDEESEASPAATAADPGATQEPTPATNAEAVEVARQYLLKQGVDGETGDFTEPRGCPEITEDSAGEFCIHDGFSIYAPGLVILVVGAKDNPDEDAWQIRLELSASDWQVTAAEAFGTTE